MRRTVNMVFPLTPACRDLNAGTMPAAGHLGDLTVVLTEATRVGRYRAEPRIRIRTRSRRQIVRHHGLTIVLASTALLLCACGPPKGKMQFDTGTTQIWSHSLVQGQKESYPPPDLEPVPTEPVAPGQLSFSLLGDEPPVILKAGVGTSYARDLTFRRQVEVHLFARD